jgi:hypothetical protein
MHITPVRNSGATKMRGRYNDGARFVAILPIMAMCIAQHLLKGEARNNVPKSRFESMLHCSNRGIAMASLDTLTE